MQTKTHFILLSFFLMSLSLNGQLIVELALFDQQVPKAYFLDIDNVLHEPLQSNIHRYYVLVTEESAGDIIARGKAIGLNPRTIDMDERRMLCHTRCIPPEDIQKTKNIFFDFDKSDIRADSRERLNILVNILNNRPSYSINLMAHTDARGSNEYNDALAVRRAESAKTYLVKNGISESRIKTSTFGEEVPIAINQRPDGTDVAEGRQLNRRVEIIIYGADGKRIDRVEEIRVPEELQN